MVVRRLLIAPVDELSTNLFLFLIFHSGEATSRLDVDYILESNQDKSLLAILLISLFLCLTLFLIKSLHSNFHKLVSELKVFGQARQLREARGLRS